MAEDKETLSFKEWMGHWEEKGKSKSNENGSEMMVYHSFFVTSPEPNITMKNFKSGLSEAYKKVGDKGHFQDDEVNALKAYYRYLFFPEKFSVEQAIKSTLKKNNILDINNKLQSDFFDHLRNNLKKNVASGMRLEDVVYKKQFTSKEEEDLKKKIREINTKDDRTKKKTISRIMALRKNIEKIPKYMPNVGPGLNRKIKIMKFMAEKSLRSIVDIFDGKEEEGKTDSRFSGGKNYLYHKDIYFNKDGIKDSFRKLVNFSLSSDMVRTSFYEVYGKEAKSVGSMATKGKEEETAFDLFLIQYYINLAITLCDIVEDITTTQVPSETIGLIGEYIGVYAFDKLMSNANYIFGKEIANAFFGNFEVREDSLRGKTPTGALPIRFDAYVKDEKDSNGNSALNYVSNDEEKYYEMKVGSDDKGDSVSVFLRPKEGPMNNKVSKRKGQGGLFKDIEGNQNVMGKVDVVYYRKDDSKDPTQNLADLRLSMKNWSRIDEPNGYREVSKSPLLYLLNRYDRAFPGEEYGFLKRYSLTLQLPKSQKESYFKDTVIKRSDGTIARKKRVIREIKAEYDSNQLAIFRNVAHQTAIIGSLLDLVGGMTQVNNYANVFLAIDRSQKRVYAIDLLKFYESSIKNIQLNLNSITDIDNIQTKFSVGDDEGTFEIDYNAARMESLAQAARNEFLNKGKMEGKTNKYFNLMNTILASTMVQAKFIGSQNKAQ